MHMNDLWMKLTLVKLHSVSADLRQMNNLWQECAWASLLVLKPSTLFREAWLILTDPDNE